MKCETSFAESTQRCSRRAKIRDKRCCPTLSRSVDRWYARQNCSCEAATTPAAKVAKALDKLETLMQHNQGANPPDFDYEFNIGYARKYTDAVPLIAEIRKSIDEETRQNALRAQGTNQS